MRKLKKSRWAVRVGVIAASAAVSALVFASTASADNIWGFVGR
jgi:hypothetical protein